MFTIGNDEARHLPPLRGGDEITCRACGEKHVVKQTFNMAKQEYTDNLLVVDCPSAGCLLVGVDGRDVRSLLKGGRHDS